MTTADWVPAGYSFTTIAKIPGTYSTRVMSDGTTIVTSGPYTGYTQTGHGGPELDYALTWESPIFQLGTPSGTTALPAATGVGPTETGYSLYGHTVPLSVLGLARIGGEIIGGPWVTDGMATFCISFGVPADHNGTRTVKEIAFDSVVVWTAAEGYLTENHFEFRWYQGTLTQAADPVEIAQYGAEAVAYRPQMLLWFVRLPLANTKFGKIPYVAALIQDGTGPDVNLGECFERLAYSPYVGFTTEQFETTGITDGITDGGMIFVEQTDFLTTIQQFGRFYRNWDILQTDKLRLVDHGNNVTADLVLDKTNLIGQMVYSRSEPNSIGRELQLTTIDPGADYTMVPSIAKRPRAPVAVTASVRTEGAYLPVVMDAFTRMALVTYTKYQEEVARKRLSGTAMIFGAELEPGDRVGIAGLKPDFPNEVYKITETLHGGNNTIEFSAESLFMCDYGAPDQYWIYVVLLMGYENAIVDESLKHHGTLTDTGQRDSTLSKFGSWSLKNPGAGNLMYTTSNDWDLSSANSDEFTVECWARLDVDPYPHAPMVMVGISFLSIGWVFLTNKDELRFSFQPVSNGFGGSGVWTNLVSSGAGLVAGVWYHLAVDKDSTGKIRLYVNGVMLGSSTPIDSNIDYNSFTSLLDIGQIGLFGTNDWQGNIDELRITKGIARYKTDGSFPVPPGAFPRGGVL